MRLCIFSSDVCFWISWHRPAREKEAAATSWPALILTFIVQVVERRVLDQTPVYKGRTTAQLA